MNTVNLNNGKLYHSGRSELNDLTINGESVFKDNTDHGKIRFLYQGDEIAEGQRIGKGSEITYEAASLDNGYWLPDGDHKIIVEGENQAKTAMKAIKFYKHEKRDVKLVYPEYGGKIIYSADVPISGIMSFLRKISRKSTKCAGVLKPHSEN